MVFTATYKLGSDIAQREVGRQVAHDVDLALGERLGQRVCAPLRARDRRACSVRISETSEAWAVRSRR
jgi:hypothetical protein